METRAEGTISEDASEALTSQDGWLEGPLNFIWENIVVGDGQFNPEKSCYALADQYRHSGKTLEECVHDFINWQTGKAGAAGFALGLPGGLAMALTIPADSASISYVQLRMIAFIDDHRAAHGVEPIRKVLPIAPSTYHEHAARRADPSRLPARTKRDRQLVPEIKRDFSENLRFWCPQGMAAVAP
jgi:hypothetical protein